MKKIGKNSLTFDSAYLKSCGSVCGPKEKDGPLGDYFDYTFDDLYCDGKSWEDSEINLQRKALMIALDNGNLGLTDLSMVLGGDLNNQIAASSYLMNEFRVPFIGLYGACSTAVLSLITGASFIDSGYNDYIACITSSHNSTSERQFRYPTEYGTQRAPSVTSTVTGAGVGILTTKKCPIRITKTTIGEVIDAGIKDSSDMGRAMAPAAATTLKQHFEDFGIDASSYDLIVTGDLSFYGSKVFVDILKEYNIDLGNKYQDTGLMIYDINNQDVEAGGSGCACVSIVMYGYLCHLLKTKKIKNVLVLATGALLNPIMTFQGKTIPCIAHAVSLEVCDD